MIPTEIVDHTLTFLHSDQDYSTLETCSLVFPQTAERHLYSHLTFHIHIVRQADLGIPVPPSRFPFDTYVVDPTKFSRILIERPHIANYVRVIRMILIEPPERPLPGRMVSFRIPAPSESTLRFRLGTPEISSILSTLPRVESIVVSSPRAFSWGMLGPEFCTAFRNIVRLASIRDVAMSNIAGLSLSLFEDSKNLRNLFFNGQSIDGEGVSASPYPRLCSFHISSQHTPVTRMVSWMKSNTLHTLSLRIRSLQSLHDFRFLIKACSTSLVNLDVDYNDYFGLSESGTIPGNFTDLQLPLLDHLIFRFRVLSPLFASYCCPFIIPFLRSIKCISSFSPIKFTLHLQMMVQTRYAASFDWTVVTTILRLPIFRHPIALHIDHKDEQDMDALLVDVISSVEQDSEMKKLLGAGKVAIIKGKLLSSIIE